MTYSWVKCKSKTCNKFIRFNKEYCNECQEMIQRDEKERKKFPMSFLPEINYYNGNVGLKGDGNLRIYRDDRGQVIAKFI